MDITQKALHEFKQGYNCSQAVFTAFADHFELPEEIALKVSSAFGGGMGRTGETCGAVTGALMVIGMAYGSTDSKNKKGKEAVYRLTKEFIGEFEARHGSSKCRELVNYDVSSPEEYKKACASRVFQTLCPKLVEDATEIVRELLGQKQGDRASFDL